MRALLAALLVAAPSAGADVPVALPPSFHRVPDAALEETVALAPLAVEGDPRRHLVALYRQDQPAPALFALSVVEAGLQLDPTRKTPLASAVSTHLRRNLGLDFELERTAFFAAPRPRVEVWGVVHTGAERRALAVAFYAGAHRHLVALASGPLAAPGDAHAIFGEAFAALDPPDPGSSPERRHTVLNAVFWLLAAAGLVALQLWRRRRQERR